MDKDDYLLLSDSDEAFDTKIAVGVIFASVRRHAVRCEVDFIFIKQHFVNDKLPVTMEKVGVTEKKNWDYSDAGGSDYLVLSFARITKVILAKALVFIKE